MRERNHNIAAIEKEDTANICTTLLWRLACQGLGPSEVNLLVKDTFSLLSDGGSFTVAFVNYELERMGWPEAVMDEQSFELILFLLETEFDYTVNAHIIH